jgi:hypothetical protein
LRRFQASFWWFLFFLLFHASMMLDLIVDAHDVVESESHPTSAWLLAPLCLIFGLHDALEKIEGLAFVSSNSENISCVAFLIHKNNKKQGTGTVASR